MKSYSILLFTLFIVIIFSLNCEREQPAIPVQPQDITGQWEWISTHKAHPYSIKTPQNTGIHEILVFNADHTWFITQNDTIVDSGEFSFGHGSFTPAPGGHTFIYDSIVYYKNGEYINGGVDYYNITNDTLLFLPYLAARFFSYSLPNNGSKRWIRSRSY